MSMQTSTHMQIHICIDTHKNIWAYTYTYKYTHTHTHTHCMHAHTCTHTCMHTHTRVHTHTHTHTRTPHLTSMMCCLSFLSEEQSCMMTGSTHTDSQPLSLSSLSPPLSFSCPISTSYNSLAWTQGGGGGGGGKGTQIYSFHQAVLCFLPSALPPPTPAPHLLTQHTIQLTGLRTSGQRGIKILFSSPGCTMLPPSPPRSHIHCPAYKSLHPPALLFMHQHFIQRVSKLSAHHSSGAVWESRWPSWAVRPNEPSGFRGRKDFLNRALALVTTCP